MSNIHARAFNLARKHSIRNENDLMQENFFGEENPSTTTESYCSGLLEKYLSPSFELPTECHQFSSIRANIQKRRSNREEENNIAFQGMSPNEALEAIRAREHGRPHQAKILRRMTSHNPHKVESSWY